MTHTAPRGGADPREPQLWGFLALARVTHPQLRFSPRSARARRPHQSPVHRSSPLSTPSNLSPVSNSASHWQLAIRAMHARPRVASRHWPSLKRESAPALASFHPAALVPALRHLALLQLRLAAEPRNRCAPRDGSHRSAKQRCPQGSSTLAAGRPHERRGRTLEGLRFPSRTVSRLHAPLGDGRTDGRTNRHVRPNCRFTPIWTPGSMHVHGLLAYCVVSTSLAVYHVACRVLHDPVTVAANWSCWCVYQLMCVPAACAQFKIREVSCPLPPISHSVRVQAVHACLPSPHACLPSPGC